MHRYASIEYLELLYAKVNILSGPTSNCRNSCCGTLWATFA